MFVCCVGLRFWFVTLIRILVDLIVLFVIELVYIALIVAGLFVCGYFSSVLFWFYNVVLCLVACECCDLIGVVFCFGWVCYVVCWLV